jgi:hypothetical protein
LNGFESGTTECVTLLDLEDILVIQADRHRSGNPHVGKTRQEVNNIIKESVLWAEIAWESSDGAIDKNKRLHHKR